MKTFLSVVCMLILIASVDAQINSVPQAHGVGTFKPETGDPLGKGMVFAENKGQIVDMQQTLRPDVLFKGDGGGAEVYIRKTGISYVLNNMGEAMHEVNEDIETLEKARKNNPIGNLAEKVLMKESYLKKQVVKIHRIDLDFLNCNVNTEVQKIHQTEGYTNYYFAHCPDGITHVNSYNEVDVKNIYDNIDIRYYGGKKAGLKYDIVVNPGGNPNDIQIKYSGADEVKIKNGELRIKNSIGEFAEKLPKVYQTIHGKIIDVNAKYRLEHLSNGDVIVRFLFSDFNSSFPLVVDPWATYYGGSNSEWSSAITTDPSGNIAFTGTTLSSNFPVTPGALQTSLSASQIAYVVKMTAAGGLVFGTYFGGSNTVGGNGIAADAAGNIIVAGLTLATNLPVGALGYQPAAGGGTTDAFLLKLDPTGARIWGTYYGGTNVDGGEDVATDGSNIYLYGTTSSATGIATVGSFQAAINNNSQDLFVTKFTPAGTRAWGSYIGGSQNDIASRVSCDPSGDIYIGGCTFSNDFPVFAGHQMFYGGGQCDDFIFKFNPSGSRIWATYYGGNTLEQGGNVIADGLGNVILGGTTFSTTGIATPGAYQPSLVGASSDLFIAKFNSIGTRQWGTYLGGNIAEILGGFAIDKNNNIYVEGEFEDGPAPFSMSACAYQPNFGGGTPAQEDQFIAKYDPKGNQLCITYIGGAGEEDIDASGVLNGGVSLLAIYGNSLYITAATNGSFPVTPGAFQTNYNGNGDIFVAQLCINICEAQAPGLDIVVNNPSVCANQAITFTPITQKGTCDTSNYSYQWTFTGANLVSSSATNPSVTYATPGTYSVKLVLNTACKKDSITKTAFITINNCSCALSVAASVNKNVSCNNGGNGVATVTISNGSGGPYSYSWSNAINGSTSNTTFTSAGFIAGTYTLTVKDGTCTSTSVVSFTQPLPLEIGVSTGWSCLTNKGTVTSRVINGTTPYSYLWSNGQTTATATGLAVNTFSVTVTDASGCTVTSTATTSDNSMSITTASNNSTCNANADASVTVTGAGPFIYKWSSGQNTASISGIGPGTYTITITDGNACTATRTINITTTSPVSATFTHPTTICTNTQANLINTGTSGTGVTYTWTINPNTVSNVSGTSTDFSTTFLATGVYNVMHQVFSGGCLATETVGITVIDCSAKPTVTATTNPVCSGSCATVNSNPQGGAGNYAYLWSTGETTQNINPCPAITTTYILTITDAASATATTNVTVTVNPAINVTATPSAGCSAGAGSITATTNGSSPFTYLWNTSATTQTVNGLNAGTYSVTVTDANGCTGSSSAIIAPSLSAQYIKGSANCTDCGCKEWIMLTASGGATPYNYLWPALSGYDKRYANKLCPGNYTIKVTDKNGCSTNVSVNTP
jgi:hypothetical protein